MNVENFKMLLWRTESKHKHGIKSNIFRYIDRKPMSKAGGSCIKQLVWRLKERRTSMSRHTPQEDIWSFRSHPEAGSKEEV